MPSAEDLFREKLTILNDNFIRYIQNMHEQNSFADFTPTINDYLQHVNELDDLYGGNQADSASIVDFQTEPFGTYNEATDNKNVIDDEDDPPKPEDFVYVEEGAVCSFKCALFNLLNGKYEKRGVAYVSLKKLQYDKMQFIIREATAIGRIWVNTFIDGNFKFQKMASNKLRITYPKKTENEDDFELDTENHHNIITEAATILLRFGCDNDLAQLYAVLSESTTSG